ncbi:MAG: hypothetical protein KDJ24_17800, partial [Gammaproteobacteria bacterium]|nr:hypothetical protein [Gammaproteobacteria bacterium]
EKSGWSSITLTSTGIRFVGMIYFAQTSGAGISDTKLRASARPVLCRTRAQTTQTMRTTPTYRLTQIKSATDHEIVGKAKPIS